MPDSARHAARCARPRPPTCAANARAELPDYAPFWAACKFEDIQSIARQNEVFLSGAIATALCQHASAVRGAGRIGECDVKSMLALARAIAHQCCRCAETDRIGARRHQRGRACPYALCHRDCGIGTACLCRYKAEKRCEGQRVVGNLCLDQQPRSAGNTKQLADRPTAAPGDRECSLAAGRV